MPRMEEGGLMHRLTTPEAVACDDAAPASTRASLRGRIIAAAEDARADLSVDWVHGASTIRLPSRCRYRTSGHASDPRVDALIAQIDAQSPTIPA